MRCDVNVSLRPEGSKKLGTRTEIKNMNSMNFIERAMKYEAARQAEILDAGGSIEQATLRYDEKTGETYVMRTKEEAQDYRYFPEPDVCEVIIPEEKIESIRASLPQLPLEKLRRYINELGISSQNAHLLYKYGSVCQFLEGAVACGAGAKNASNLVVGTIYSTLGGEEDKEKFDIGVSPEEFAKLVKYVDDGKISYTLAQTTLLKMLKERTGPDAFLSAEDVAGVDEGALAEICRQAIESNRQAVNDFLGGKEKALSALYGFIKRATGGRADLRKADEIIRHMLKNGQ